MIENKIIVLQSSFYKARYQRLFVTTVQEFVDAFGDPQPEIEAASTSVGQGLTEVEVEESPNEVGDSVG